MRPPFARSASRSERTESLIPAIARDSSRNPAGPALRWPRTTAFQRLPRNLNARASRSAAGTHSSAGIDVRGDRAATLPILATDQLLRFPKRLRDRKQRMGDYGHE